MNKKIIFIIGGARSGKSSFVLKEASKISGRKAYIATAEALDREMKERIEKHKKDRGNNWDTYEEPLKVSTILSDIKDKYNVIVLDCLTLWLSNMLNRAQNTEPAYSPRGPARTGGEAGRTGRHRTQIIEDNIQGFIDVLKDFSVCSLGSGFCNLYVVSNEVGMGIVPDNKMAREFRDWAGFLNQKIAEIADEVYLIAAGIPLRIKERKQ